MKALKTAMLFCIAYTSLSFHCFAQSGIITTVTVDDNSAFAGRQFVVNNWPSDIAVDSSGNLYIPDSRKQCVRKVTPDGKITNIAGTGQKGFSGDSGPATAAQLSSPGGVALDSAGNLYIADSGNNRIRKVALSSPQSSK
jgi:trimeric autotransporter adhesin